jgi:hypothetical protein
MLRNTLARFNEVSSYRFPEDIKKKMIEKRQEIIAVIGEMVTKTRPKQSHGPQ